MGDLWVSHTRTAHSYSLSQSSRQVVVTDIEDNSHTLGFGRPEPDISHEYTLVVKSTEGEVNCESNGARTLFEYLTKLKTKLENRANSRARYNRNNLVKTVLDSL